MVAQQLIAGLGNQQHQSRILAEATTLTTLPQKIERLQCLESTEESTSQMRTNPLPYPSRAEFSRQSAYRTSGRQQHRQPWRQPNPRTTACKGCGRASHGSDKTMARKDCPAFNKPCLSCGIVGHFTNVCRKSRSNSRSNSNAIEQTTDVPYVEDPTQDDATFAFATQDFRLAPNDNGQFI
jgi:hypothetical protein